MCCWKPAPLMAFLVCQTRRSNSSLPHFTVNVQKFKNSQFIGCSISNLLSTNPIPSLIIFHISYTPTSPYFLYCIYGESSRLLRLRCEPIYKEINWKTELDSKDIRKTQS